jgi:lipoate-protein ligase A
MRAQWLFSVEPELSGSENMLRDEAMAHASGVDGIPRIRLYSWRPYTLSLGHHQPDAQIARTELAGRGIDLVRRPTGGRAVLHAEEITYAVTMAAEGASVHETYAKINEGLRRALEDLGATDIDFTRHQPDFRAHYGGPEDSTSCFSTSALSELMWQGRKLVGSAQRRYGDILLQHGSLLLGDAHLDIIDLLSSTVTPERRAALRQRLAARTATLADILPSGLPPFETIAEALAHGIAGTFDGLAVRVDEITEPLSLHQSEGSPSWPTPRG